MNETYLRYLQIAAVMCAVYDDRERCATDKERHNADLIARYEIAKIQHKAMLATKGKRERSGPER